MYFNGSSATWHSLFQALTGLRPCGFGETPLCRSHSPRRLRHFLANWYDERGPFRDRGWESGLA